MSCVDHWAQVTMLLLRGGAACWQGELVLDQMKGPCLLLSHRHSLSSEQACRFLLPNEEPEERACEAKEVGAFLEGLSFVSVSPMSSDRRRGSESPATPCAPVPKTQEAQPRPLDSELCMLVVTLATFWT